MLGLRNRTAILRSTSAVYCTYHNGIEFDMEPTIHKRIDNLNDDTKQFSGFVTARCRCDEFAFNRHQSLIVSPDTHRHHIARGKSISNLIDNANNYQQLPTTTYLTAKTPLRQYFRGRSVKCKSRIIKRLKRPCGTNSSSYLRWYSTTELSYLVHNRSIEGLSSGSRLQRDTLHIQPAP
jgi:hypothetical protein